MITRTPDNIALLEDLKRIQNLIPVDLGGCCTLSNSFLMSHLILEYNLKNYLEIGVYRGRSFFAAAYAVKILGGMAYGIDPYDYESIEKQDLEYSFHPDVNAFLASVNLSQIYDDVLKLRDELALSDNSKIIREKSNIAANLFRRNKIAIDMLHINSYHNPKQVSEDIDLYLPFVRIGGFVVMDDLNWDLDKPAVNRLKRKFDRVFNIGRFTIFSNNKTQGEMAKLQKSRFSILHGMIENLEQNTTPSVLNPESTDLPVVSVVVITFNQEKYIAECLEGIFAQKGDFKIDLVIGDDCSTDKTLKIIRKYVDSLRNNRCEEKILPADKNIGMTKNFQRCLAVCTGSYIAVCEGDDYWIDCNKLQKQMNFLKTHPESALCFNDCYIYYQEKGELTKLDVQQRLESDVGTTREIILTYYMGNLSCCMYNARFMRKIPDNLFDLYIGDWMFNIYYSQFGDIGHVKEIMSVYRKHAAGVWSGGDPKEQDLHLWEKIEEYNRFLSYNFDHEFSIVQKRIEMAYTDMFYKEPVDLAIIDNAISHAHSAFRMQEFIYYLEEFNDLRIFFSSGALGLFDGEKTVDELIADFKRKSPEYSGMIKRLESDTIINARVLYMDFLDNAYSNIERIEQLGIPFVFTLYPGGGFGLHIAESDRMLKRVISSPCFRKVIATQKVTYDYLLTKHFCRPDQIKFIFGVVTPLKQIETEYTGKKHYGIDKNNLDICFVTDDNIKKGIDQGYDIFIDVAHQLCQHHDNINFHVVGGIDAHEIDVSDLKGKITFYGKRGMEWFNGFYKDKDIILSLNIPRTMYPGSFDGFPTGSCVDAGLRKTAIFCTDEIGLNAKALSSRNEFVEGEEIVILPRDAGKITSMIERYYNNTQKLKAIAENGSLRIKRLYGFEAQILPRITLLKKEIELSGSSKGVIIKTINGVASINSQNVYSIRSVAKLFIQVVGSKPASAMSDTGKKFGMIFRRVRHLFAPSGSRRARILRRMYKNSSQRFMKLIKQRSTKRDLALIRSSDLFDEAWYLANNPDVAQVKIDPADHYLDYGGFEGRDPGPNFSSQGYLETYEDVKKSGINQFIHYIKYGRKEGRVCKSPQQDNINDTFFRCPVCQEKVEAFTPLNSYYEENWEKYGFLYNSDDFETLNSSRYFCPKCGASDRDRLYALYLARMIDQDLTGNPIKIIDIAPSYPLKMFLLKYPNIKYQSADKYMKDVDLVVDITNMNSIPQESYDVFICSHVLEHVSDDQKALFELFRILKPGGSGILMVPINVRIDEIREDPTITDIGERWRRFGQDDHIRLYSKKGFIERVEETGFTIDQYGVDYFGEDAFFLYGISPKSILYIVKKKR